MFSRQLSNLTILEYALTVSFKLSSLSKLDLISLQKSENISGNDGYNALRPMKIVCEKKPADVAAPKRGKRSRAASHDWFWFDF